MQNIVYDIREKLEVEYLENFNQNNMRRHHYHDAYEIYLQLDGERYIAFNDKYYYLQRGDMFVIKPFVLHGTKNIAPNYYFKRYIINIKSEMFLPIIQKPELDKLFKNIHTGIIHLNEEETKKAHDYFKQADEYYKRQTKRGTFLALSVTAQLLDFMEKKFISLDNINNTAPVLEKYEIFYAINYINLHYAEEINLDFISDYVHMSKSNFCLVFHKLTGDSFKHYLNKFRAMKAHSLLIDTTLPLHEIAEKTGFSSTAHMTRIFNQIHNMSPSAFKRNFI